MKLLIITFMNALVIPLLLFAALVGIQGQPVLAQTDQNTTVDQSSPNTSIDTQTSPSATTDDGFQWWWLLPLLLIPLVLLVPWGAEEEDQTYQYSDNPRLAGVKGGRRTARLDERPEADVQSLKHSKGKRKVA